MAWRTGAHRPRPATSVRESVELAFTAALQHLPARQRAVLILRDVIGLSAGEVAEALDSTPASIYSALQRAHASVEERLPARSQQATLRALGDVRLRALVESHVDAWERGDVESLVSLLTDDVTLTMPPIPRGSADAMPSRRSSPDGRSRTRAAGACCRSGRAGRSRSAPTCARSDRDVYAAHVIEVLTLRGDRIAEIVAFMSPDAFPAFGLPMELDG